MLASEATGEIVGEDKPRRGPGQRVVPGAASQGGHKGHTKKGVF